MSRVWFVIAFAVLGVAPAHAETRGSVRVGVIPLDLEPSTNTPVFGGDVERAIERYNAAADAYDRMFGTTTSRLTSGDLGLQATLYVIAPGIELGGHHYYLRLEAPIGFGGNVTTIGLGVYPINLQTTLQRGVVGYLSAGGTASWLDRPGGGDVGGLLVARGAAGARFAGHFTFELGYSPYAVGGNVNNERIADLTREDLLRLQAGVMKPSELLAAGESHGLVDVSVGVTF